ncbi:MAG: hypothetical protein HQ512_08600 [Rhodospirillales bacterium]|nr:hypothetical protein [Rhodospirillales bacterium]
MDWIIGISSLIAMIIAISALSRISRMQSQISRKMEGTLRAALGTLKADANENAKLLKKMSDRILEIEGKFNRNRHVEANKTAEIIKLRKENQKLRERKESQGFPARRVAN